MVAIHSVRWVLRALVALFWFATPWVMAESSELLQVPGVTVQTGSSVTVTLTLSVLYPTRTVAGSLLRDRDIAVVKYYTSLDVPFTSIVDFDGVITRVEPQWSDDGQAIVIDARTLLQEYTFTDAAANHTVYATASVESINGAESVIYSPIQAFTWSPLFSPPPPGLNGLFGG